MKNMRELLDTFTESEWKKAKKEMTKELDKMDKEITIPLKKPKVHNE